MLLKSKLAPFAWAAVALADTCDESITASSQSDLDNLSSCTTFTGDITLASPLTSAVLNGIQSIDGSLTASNITTLRSISAPNLVNISDTLTLNILQSLNSASFPLLTEVGSISLVTLNALNTISLDAGISSADSLVISDTTLNSISGINLTTVDTLNINNNRYLTSLSFNLRSVSNLLDFSSTGNRVEVNFPDLIWANNITLRDCNVVTLPAVTKINSTLSFTNNTLESISCPQLTEVGGSLAIVSNSQLTNLSFPKLGSIGGGFQIANNTKLLSIDGFPNLTTIGGAIDFIGDFDNATLPEISIIRGGVYIESDSDNFNCSSWNEVQEDSIIRGDSYECKGASVSTSVAISTAAETGSATGSGSAASATATGSSSSSNGANLISVEYSVFGAIAALIFQFL